MTSQSPGHHLKKLESKTLKLNLHIHVVFRSQYARNHFEDR